MFTTYTYLKFEVLKPNVQRKSGNSVELNVKIDSFRMADSRSIIFWLLCSAIFLNLWMYVNIWILQKSIELLGNGWFRIFGSCFNVHFFLRAALSNYTRILQRCFKSLYSQIGVDELRIFRVNCVLCLKLRWVNCELVRFLLLKTMYELRTGMQLHSWLS